MIRELLWGPNIGRALAPIKALSVPLPMVSLLWLEFTALCCGEVYHASGLHIHFIKHESVIATEVDRFTHLAVPLICMAVTVQELQLYLPLR